MAVITHPFVILGLVSTAAALAIGMVAWYQRDSPGAREYTALMIVLSVWSACYVIQLLQPTVTTKEPWLVARHAITPLIGVLFWIFAARYTDRWEALSTRYMGPIVAVGSMLTGIIILNPESIYWVDLTRAVTESLVVVDISFGPVFWLNAGYTLGLVGVGHLFIVIMFQDSLDVYKPQLTAMTVVGGIEFGLAAMFLSDHMTFLPSFNPWPHIQLITYGMTISVIPIGWSYVNGALFELQPLAEQTVIENMDDAVFVFDQNDILRYTNGPAVQLLDPSMESTIEGQTVETVFVDRPQLLAKYRQTDPSGETGTETHEFAVDGKSRYYDLRGSTITNSIGVTTGAVVVARDVTEKRRRSRQLREQTTELEAKKTQLEQQNKQLDQFSSFVSHDLRSPLQVASGHLQLAKKTDDLSHLDRVDESIRRMERMVEDLRELTRIDQNELNTKPVDINSTANQAWAHVDTQEATLQVAEMAAVVADREFLLHVFENLFRNSIDHGPTDVTVRVGPLADGIYIEDNGPGIPQEDRNAVLEHGYSTSTNGTGLGMSIVRTIAEAHGWTITVSESEEGGARFEFMNVDKDETSAKRRRKTANKQTIE